MVNANSIKGKQAELQNILVQTDADVAIISETKLGPEIYNAEFLPANYLAVRKDRNVHGGGVMVLTKDKFITSEVKVPGKSEQCWVRIESHKAPPLIIGGAYRPPSETLEESKLPELDKSIEHIFSKGPKNLILAGDLNCPGINWELGKVEEGNPKPSICNQLLDIFSKHGLDQLQRVPTMGQNILDLVATNCSSLVTDIRNIPGISTANEHEALLLEVQLQVKTTKKKPHKVFQWNKVDWEALKRDASQFNEDFLTSEADASNDADTHFTKFESFIDSLLQKVPTRMTKVREDVPWLTPSLKRAVRKKQRLYNSWKRTKSASKRAAFEEHQTTVNKALKFSRWQYINGIVHKADQEKSSKPFYRYVKSCKSESVGVQPLKDSDGAIRAESVTKAKLLAKQYASVQTDDATDPCADACPEGDPIAPDIGELTISVEGVEKLLRNINPCKATGPDGVPGRLLKELAAELAPAVTRLFRLSFSSGKLPDVWKTAWITPIFKKGLKCLPENYRPVSLTCILCKIMEHIVNDHIRKHLDQHKLITPAQHGFLKRHSCESQLFVTTEDLLRRLDKKHKIHMAVLDFSKAFDVVPHKRLLRKMRHYGIAGQTLAWLKEFLTGRTQSVLVDGVRSHGRPGDKATSTDGDPVKSGVPQGTVLGPLCFLVFINDLPEVVSPGTAVRLFADDCLLYRSATTQDDINQLQSDLTAVYDWGIKWGMRFNVTKCNMLIMARERAAGEDHVRFYSMNGEPIRPVEEAKYLGVTLSHDMRWDSHIRNVEATASRTLGFLKRNLKGAPFHLRALAYTSMVQSTMDYAASIWDPHEKTKASRLERVHNRAARWACRERNRGAATVDTMLAKLGWTTMEERRRRQRLTLVWKVLKGEVDVAPADVGLHLAARPDRAADPNPLKLARQRASDRCSPLWRATSMRTAEDFNRLTGTIVKADNAGTFSRSLAAATPALP